ncbi:hypothetical protein CCP3SC1AL1_690004 [Gammaproteobacteria bacterium]
MSSKWKGIDFSKDVHENKPMLIIDFYNIYCTYISFHKTKTFTLESFIDCMHFILGDILCPSNCIFVSKPIYEVPLETITYFTSKYKTKYLIVKDEYASISKGENRERDDYVCLLLSYILKSDNNKSYIISNDRFSNYNTLIRNVKPLSIEWFGCSSTPRITNFTITQLKQTVPLLHKWEQDLKKTTVTYTMF